MVLKMEIKNNEIYAQIVNGKYYATLTKYNSPIWCECGIDNIDKNGNIIHPYCIKTVNITNLTGIQEGDYYDIGRKLFYKEDEIWSNEELKYIPDVDKIEAKRLAKLKYDASGMFNRDEKYISPYYWNKYNDLQRDELSLYLDTLQDIINGEDKPLPLRHIFLP